MTYCAPQEYEFTALTGADILDPGDVNLNCGDSFAMPVSATACLTVTDNDGTLSGDACRNEWGDDTSWQIADIMVDGVLLEDDAKIYAEEYYTLHDDQGNCYYLIEIEVACTDTQDIGDYYAFYGDVPPAGTNLTVVGKANVTGNWLDYRCMSAGLKWDPDTDGKITIEAEDMALKGYKVDDVHAASGGEVIRLRRCEGEASVTFGAETGTYTLELAYIDENDGEGEIEIWVGDTLIHTISLDQNNNGNGNDWSSISTVKVEGVALTQGEEITLKGTRDAWEKARIDALTFCPESNSPPEAEDDTVTTDEDTPAVLDLLANDSDPDGDTLTVTFANAAAAGTEFAVTSAGSRAGLVTVTAAGILTFTPSEAFQDMGASDTDTVTVNYEITDGNGETATATATITVTGLNDGPTALDDAYTVSESALATLDILTNDSDPENDPLTVTLLSQPIEGSVTLDASGNAIFDPGSDFTALEDGQTATVTFTYEISDGEFTDTATVTVTVLGEGVCIPELTTTSTTITLTDPLNPTAQPFNPFTTTSVTIDLETPEFTKSGFADLNLSISRGDRATETFNFVYVVDVSGSTAVADSFSTGKTVLEAEIDALQSLTADILALGLPEDRLSISIVPFSSSVQIVDFNPTDEDFNFVQQFDGAIAATGAVSDALGLLSAGGETNYFAALAVAGSVLQQQGGFAETANNFVYFLSDGVPFPATPPPAALEGFSAQLKSFAAVHAIGIGDLVPDTTFLDPIDNTGGAQVINEATQGIGVDLEAALLAALDEAPVDDTFIHSAELRILDGSGAELGVLAFSGSDFEETRLGFDFNLADQLDQADVFDFFETTGLNPTVGETNRLEFTLFFDVDGDGVADSVDGHTLVADIDGMRPVSFDEDIGV